MSGCAPDRSSALFGQCVGLSCHLSDCHIGHMTHLLCHQMCHIIRPLDIAVVDHWIYCASGVPSDTTDTYLWSVQFATSLCAMSSDTSVMPSDTSECAQYGLIHFTYSLCDLSSDTSSVPADTTGTPNSKVAESSSLCVVSDGDVPCSTR
jgi:hypothetical protein